MKRILVSLTAIAMIGTAHAQTFFGTGVTASTFYGGAIFDVKNVSTSSLDLTGRLHFVSSWTGDGVYRVYTKAGSYVGSDSTLADWTLWGEAAANGAGPTSFATLDLGSMRTLAANETIGVAFFHVGGSGHANGDGAVGYRTGTNTFSDGTLSIKTGVAKGYGTFEDPFNIHTLDPRTWAGELEYNAAPVPEPATLAVLGLGLAATIRRRRARK